MLHYCDTFITEGMPLLVKRLAPNGPSSWTEPSLIMMLLNAKHTQLAHTAMQIEGIKTLPLSGVHLSTPSDYIPLQHPFLHREFLEHCVQSPSDLVLVVGGSGCWWSGCNRAWSIFTAVPQ